MGEDSKPKSFTDDITKLFDLVKEGATYLIHFYLYFFSKTFPLDFIGDLFDHHKENSSYDFSKDGKTYLYRLFSCIFEVEKQLVAMGLQYIQDYIPLPIVKNIYENFCVNNNLECTDVKLKKCKKALINTSKDTKKKLDQTGNGKKDDEPVSRPIPLFPITPKPDNENTVSFSPSITSNSINFLQQTNPTRSLKDSSGVNMLSSPITTPDSTNNSSKQSSEIFSSGELSSKSQNGDYGSKIIENPISTPDLGSRDTLINSNSNIRSSPPSSSLPSSSIKPSKIPIKVSRGNIELPLTAPLGKIPNNQDSSKSLILDTAVNSMQGKPSNDSTSKSSPSPTIFSTPKGVSKNQSQESTIPSSSKSNTGSSKLIPDFSIPTPTISPGNNVEVKSDPFSDLTKIFNPPATSSNTDTSSLSPNPFAIFTPSDSSKPSSSFVNPGDLFSNLMNTSPATTTTPKSQTVPSTFQSPNTRVTMKGDESVAPIPKIITPSLNSFQQAIDQNNKVLEKNLEDFGKSISDAFTGGASALTPGPSSTG